jgi:hypothetical protein
MPVCDRAMVKLMQLGLMGGELSYLLSRTSLIEPSFFNITSVGWKNGLQRASHSSHTSTIERVSCVRAHLLRDALGSLLLQGVHQWLVGLLAFFRGWKEGEVARSSFFFFRCLGNTTSLRHSPRVLCCVVLCCVVLCWNQKKLKFALDSFRRPLRNKCWAWPQSECADMQSIFFSFIYPVQACKYATPLRLRCNTEHSKPRPSLLMIGLLLVRLCLRDSLLNRS